MLLTRLIQGLGALSLAHLAVAAESPLDRRTDEHYEPECWGCWKTVTVTKPYTVKETVTKTHTSTETCYETVTRTRE